MRRAIRQIATGTLTLPSVARLMKRVNRDRAVVFMLHRFEDPAHRIPGHSLTALREVLEFLRRHGYALVHVDEMLRAARSPQHTATGPAVAFIMDDGYWEHAELAAPVFAEFDAPAAIFPVSGFVDGKLWLWWDRLRTILSLTSRTHITLHEELDEDLPGPITLSLAQPAPELLKQRRALEEVLKVLSSDARDAFLDQLAVRCEVELPESPPAWFRSMSWDDARRCERMGIRVGPHTVSHPILSRESDDRARWEMQESWQRIQAEVDEPVRVFCYPNGEPSDFGRREMEIVRALGLEGALTARPGYMGLSPAPQTNGSGEFARFSMPRYPFNDRFHDFVRVVSGLTRGGVQHLPPRP